MPELIPTMKTRKSARLSKDHDPLVRYLASLPHDQRMACVAGLNEGEQRELKVHWRVWARDGQLPPAGEWLAWLIMAGRG